MRRRLLAVLGGFTLLVPVVCGQALSFEVASVRASQRVVGPDYNNQLAFSETGLRARNVTLKRLVATAYRLQLNQVAGPGWLDQNEYDIEAQAGRTVIKDDVIAMLQSLLASRFALKHHSETRNMRAYELIVDKAGVKIQPLKEGEQPAKGSGSDFSGDMRQLADLIAIQLTIPAPADPTAPARASGNPAPVLDKTELAGIYEFRLDIRPEPGADGFTLWNRVLQDQLGLKLTSRRADVPVIVVDTALRVPTEN